MIAAEFKVHPDVQAFGEEWSGITDPIVRRKLQNRLNQRAARMQAKEHAVTQSDALTRL